MPNQDSPQTPHVHTITLANGRQVVVDFDRERIARLGEPLTGYYMPEHVDDFRALHDHIHRDEAARRSLRLTADEERLLRVYEQAPRASPRQP